MDGGRDAKRRRTGEVEDTVSAENVQQDLDEDEEIRQMRLMVGMDDTLDFEVRSCVVGWLVVCVILHH